MSKADPMTTSDLEDWHILYGCAKWQSAKAAMLSRWAMLDEVTMFGHLPDPPKHQDPLLGLEEEFERHEAALAILEANWPRTATGAVEVLKILLQIQATRDIDPEHRLGKGNLLLILRQLKEALDYLPGDTLLGPPRRKSDD